MGLLSHAAPISGEYPIHSKTMFLLAFFVPWRFQLPNLGLWVWAGLRMTSRGPRGGPSSVIYQGENRFGSPQAPSNCVSAHPDIGTPSRFRGPEVDSLRWTTVTKVTGAVGSRLPHQAVRWVVSSLSQHLHPRCTRAERGAIVKAAASRLGL
jgi:hypothetical protein